MATPAPDRIFLWLDRAFWLIWLCFPLFLWITVRDILAAPETMAALAPAQAACIADLPMAMRFSPIGQIAFWSGFALSQGVFLVLMGLVHWVIHRCATGHVFVGAVIGVLRTIGIVVAVWPLIDLAIQNVTGAIYYATGDLAAFQPYVNIDVTVVGFGLLLVAMAAALTQALRLKEDVDLTV